MPTAKLILSSFASRLGEATTAFVTSPLSHRNSPNMGSAEKICLQWNDFESNISVAFLELREDKDFFDITLTCDDDQIQAHKVILSACSPFFRIRSVLRKNPHQHPLLAVLNFMLYHGEVNEHRSEPSCERPDPEQCLSK